MVSSHTTHCVLYHCFPHLFTRIIKLMNATFATALNQVSREVHLVIAVYSVGTMTSNVHSAMCSKIGEHNAIGIAYPIISQET